MTKDSFTFTYSELIKIKPPEKGQVKYKDDKLTGLVLIASYGGTKTFYYGKKTNGRYKLKWIGHFPEISIAEARKKAANFKKQIVSSSNPIEKIEIKSNNISPEITFEEFFNKYINDHAKLKNSTWQADVVKINKYAKSLYNKGLSTIQREDIRQIFNNCLKPNSTNPRITGKTTANRCIATLSAIFNIAIKWGFLEKNPTVDITKHKEESRERSLTFEEIKTFFKVLEDKKIVDPLMKDYVYISFYTGARKGNVLSMEWKEIDLISRTWKIPASKTKNGKTHLLPLMNEAVKILKKREKENKKHESNWVFPSPRRSKTGHFQEPKKAWKKLIEAVKAENSKFDEDFRIHDMRRTTGSLMASRGASEYIIGKALGHQSPKSTAVYARVHNIDPVREFMEKGTDSFGKPNIMDKKKRKSPKIKNKSKAVKSRATNKRKNKLIIGKALGYQSPKSTAVYAKEEIKQASV